MHCFLGEQTPRWRSNWLSLHSRRVQANHPSASGARPITAAGGNEPARHAAAQHAHLLETLLLETRPQETYSSRSPAVADQDDLLAAQVDLLRSSERSEHRAAIRTGYTRTATGYR